EVAACDFENPLCRIHEQGRLGVIRAHGVSLSLAITTLVFDGVRASSPRQSGSRPDAFKRLDLRLETINPVCKVKTLLGTSRPSPGPDDARNLQRQQGATRWAR